MQESPPSASSLLKIRTAAAHQALDHNPLLRRLLGPQLDIATYGEILAVFFGFYRDYEMTVHRLCDQADLAWQERTKLPWLVADLVTLGLGVPSDSEASALGVHSEAAAYGMLYVMEGATLGGQIISKHLARSLNLRPDRGTAFFSSYGAQVAARWRQTQAALDAYGDRGGDVDAMLTGAEAAFAELAQRFTARSARLAASAQASPQLQPQPHPSPSASGDKPAGPDRAR